MAYANYIPINRASPSSNSRESRGAAKTFSVKDCRFHRSAVERSNYRPDGFVGRTQPESTIPTDGVTICRRLSGRSTILLFFCTGNGSALQSTSEFICHGFNGILEVDSTQRYACIPGGVDCPSTLGAPK
jgi:hypothetical protein